MKAAAAAVELFLLYETAVFAVKASTVQQKLWAVGVYHEQRKMPNPVKDNSYIQFIMKHALAADAPPKPKVPVTNRVLAELRSRLDLDTVPAFTLWAGIRFAIALCCRISEWAIDGKHLLR